MDLRISAARRSTGLIPRSALLRFGMTDRRIADAVGAGDLVRLRPGVFASRTEWDGLDRSGRARLIALAGAGAVPALALSHLSAAAVHGLPFVACHDRRVHRLDPSASGGSSKSGTVLHRGRPDPTATVVDGAVVTGLERTLVDIAATEAAETVVPMLDAALFAGRTTTDRLLAELEDRAPGRGAVRARERILFASPLANRPGESLSRVRMHQLGYAPPVLQQRMRGPAGRTYDVDFWWEEGRIAGEFDGAEKYSRDEFRRGRTPTAVVVDEKRREDELRRIVDGFGRWDWMTAWEAPRLDDVLRVMGVPCERRRPG